GWTFTNSDSAVQLESGSAVARRVQQLGELCAMKTEIDLEVVKAIRESVLKTSNSALIRRIRRILSQE
ncbi:hypothetical protein Gogos_017913, partial [Gossypium gossypioides]|nr:hypothetical protein [Gossypium gossypioides]